MFAEPAQLAPVGIKQRPAIHRRPYSQFFVLLQLFPAFVVFSGEVPQIVKQTKIAIKRTIKIKHIIINSEVLIFKNEKRILFT